jgi:hypothetical protein
LTGGKYNLGRVVERREKEKKKKFKWPKKTQKT